MAEQPVQPISAREAPPFPPRSIEKAVISSDHILRVGEPRIPLTQLIAAQPEKVGENAIFFNRGHSAFIYEGGLSWLPDENVYEVHDPQAPMPSEKVTRHVILDADWLINHPLLPVNTGMQDSLLRYMGNEVRNTILTYLQIYIPELQDPATDPDTRELLQGVVQERMKLVPADLRQLESMRHFLDNTRSVFVTRDEDGNLTDRAKAYLLLNDDITHKVAFAQTLQQSNP